MKVDRIEAKLERKKKDWTAHDVAQLRVSYSSIKQGTVNLDEEFPPARVNAAEIIQGVEGAA